MGKKIKTARDKSKKAIDRRTATFALRLTPKLRYLAELAARKQHRSLSSFVEMAIEKALEEVKTGRGDGSFMSAAREIWDVDESDRFLKLAVLYPELLNFMEDQLWKIIKETPAIWKKKIPDGKPIDAAIWANVNWEVLREQWENLKKAAEGKESEDVLATASILEK